MKSESQVVHNGALRVLLVEDNSDHAALIERTLNKVRTPEFKVKWVTRFNDALRSIETSTYDVILLDLRLPDSDLQETFLRTRAASPDVPVIALTSLEDFDFAVGLVKQGAQDYIVKSDASTALLSRAIHYAIERKKIQRDLAHYAGELERTNRELDQFARVVSHDLKSPLAVIQLQASTLQSELGPGYAEQRSALKSIVEMTRQMSTLVDDLLRYARMGAGKMEFERIVCGELLAFVLSELRPQVESIGAEITSDPLPTLWANRTGLMQVFQNLITNSIKYRADHSPRIHISAALRGPDWVFSVQDQGSGIAKENQERVFDMFTRLREDVPGTGVGLAICKRVIEAHGGRIWVKSEPGRGATFFFNLFNRPQDLATGASPAMSSNSSSAPPQDADPSATAATSQNSRCNV